MQLDHKAEMVRRREKRSARVPGFSQVKRANILGEIAKMLRPPRVRAASRSRYSGAALRAIRARKVNFLGEMQR